MLINFDVMTIKFIDSKKNSYIRAVANIVNLKTVANIHTGSGKYSMERN